MSPGDVIVQLGQVKNKGAGYGRPLRRKEELDQALDMYDPGDTLPVTVLRPRKFGQFNCAQNEQKALAEGVPASAFTEAAKESHEEVHLSVGLRKSTVYARGHEKR